jgi:hypothetical protein
MRDARFLQVLHEQVLIAEILQHPAVPVVLELFGSVDPDKAELQVRGRFQIPNGIADAHNLVEFTDAVVLF